ncbi:F-box domain-containing protein [Tothia fuscella]|uniref:F-box domain-containing protein n=1 Tax=Tothia fuscella TaxID=1048955 RepID=A0A9P4NXS1_9PEZI|nr:F-box domain-containing protein [Tothia fuscella]
MAMVPFHFSEDDIFAHLAHRPHYILDSVISLDESAHLSFMGLQNRHFCPLGDLGKLPLEILHESLGYLDLQSISRLSRVSWRGQAVVGSLVAHRDLVKSASHTFKALSRAGILALHSVTVLHGALQSENCSSCGAYGAFLLLLSAERCCYVCLAYNQSQWMISAPSALASFGLTKPQLKALPSLRSIPGKYCISPRRSRQRSVQLFSVRAVKELALKILGSLEALEEKYPLNYWDHSSSKLDKMRCYRQAPLLPFAPNLLASLQAANRYNDEYGGMGTIPFPSMLEGVTQQGLWCRGCELTSENYNVGELDADTLSQLIPHGCHAGRFLLNMQYRAWSEEAFLQHAKHCHSAASVISQRWMRLT